MTYLHKKHLAAKENQNYYQENFEKQYDLLKQHYQNGTNSIWHLNENKDVAFNIAKQLDSTPIKQRNPLYGLTFGVKDLFHVKGMKTTAGSEILDNLVSPYTSSFVNRLMNQHALPLAKVSMDEFAMGSFTNTSFYGKTTMLGNPKYTTGGSSGGSAVALKADLFDFTIGSDTGGSVRQPAAFCGIYGYKPSYGAFSRHGMIAYASSLDQAGIFTQSLDDLLYLIDNINTSKCEYDMTSHGFDKTYQNNHDSNKMDTNLKVGYINFENNNSQLRNSFDKKIIDLYKEKLQTMENQIKLVEIDLNKDLSLLSQAANIYYVIACAEAASNLARYQGVYYGKSLSDFVHNELKNPNINYYDAVSKYRTRYFGKEVQSRILLGNHILSSDNFDLLFNNAKQMRAELSKQIDNVFDKYQLDMICLPTFPKLTPTWSDIENMTQDEIYASDFLTVGFSLAGLPVITIPYLSIDSIVKHFQQCFEKNMDMNLLNLHTKEGTGFQFVGRKFQDYKLINDCFKTINNSL